MARLAFVTRDHVGEAMSAPGVRVFHFAQGLTNDYDITVHAPDAAGLGEVAFEPLPHDTAELARRLRGADRVVAQRLPIGVMKALRASGTTVVHDLFVPYVAEYLAAYSRRRAPAAERLLAEAAVEEQRYALATGSAFACANERQHDLWLGSLATVGRIGRRLYERDPSLETLVTTVPTGVASAAPPPRPGALKGVVEGIGADDRVLLWAGGIWEWLDPLTPIRAVRRLVEQRPDVRLVFLGALHPRVPETDAVRGAVELAQTLGLLDRHVFFLREWVPYAERHAYLLDADVAVSAHFADIESELALRTRMLDHAWAGLPTVATRGDVLADELVRRGAARTVAAGDDAGFAAAVGAFLDDEARRADAAGAARAYAAELAWPRMVDRLRRLLEAPASPPPSRAAARGAERRERLLRLKASLALGGPGALVARQLRKRRPR